MPIKEKERVQSEPFLFAFLTLSHRLNLQMGTQSLPLSLPLHQIQRAAKRGKKEIDLALFYKNDNLHQSHEGQP